MIAASDYSVLVLRRNDRASIVRRHAASAMFGERMRSLRKSKGDGKTWTRCPVRSWQHVATPTALTVLFVASRRVRGNAPK